MGLLVYALDGCQCCVGACVLASELAPSCTPQGAGSVETGVCIFEMVLCTPITLK